MSSKRPVNVSQYNNEQRNVVPLGLTCSELDVSKAAKSSSSDSADLGEGSVCLLPFHIIASAGLDSVVLKEVALPVGKSKHGGESQLGKCSTWSQQLKGEGQAVEPEMYTVERYCRIQV